ncbi:MAG TPA: hypothetical protein ENF55_01800 [Thermoprotei archaeon]|nr:hypothetical protein [Thermoprotei archaeon]
MSWRLEHRGRALKEKLGESLSTYLKVFSEEETTLKVRVTCVSEGLKVCYSPKLELKRGENLVNLSIQTPSRDMFKSLWLIKVVLEGAGKAEDAYIGVLPVSETASKKTIRQGLRDDRNYSVGAIGFVKTNAYYLSYRWRNGNKERGEFLEISRSSDGLEYSEVKKFCRKDYGYLSFEQSDFAAYPSGVVFLYSADVERRWRIFKVDAEKVEDIELPGVPVIDNAKDPAVAYCSSSGEFIVAYSDCSQPGHDLNIVTTKDFKSFETKVKGLFKSQLRQQGNDWSKKHIHAGSITFSDKYYVLFYDALPEKPSCFGSGWLGIAISEDLKNWIDLTPDKPLWKGSGVDHTFRYVAVYCSPEKYFLYAEEETTPNGRKDTVVYYRA